MTELQWQTLVYFSKDEKYFGQLAFGNPYKMNFKFMTALDKYRAFLRLPIIPHYGFSSTGHAPNSLHKKGRALDCHIVTPNITELIQKIDFTWWLGGLGWYPYWNIPGIHLDDGLFRRWTQLKDKTYVKGILL